jgi:alpha-glucosidase/alpha-D-xyloside xylohydrolase
MAQDVTRRVALKRLGAAGAGFALGGGIIRGQGAAITIAGQPVEIAVTPISPVTTRLMVRQVTGGEPIADTGALAQAFGPASTTARDSAALSRVTSGELVVRFTDSPPTLHVERADGTRVQRLAFDPAAADVSFLLPDGPLLGLGEGGPQFDRKGSADRMRNGQGGYQLATHGTRAPVQWLVGTDGWGLFIHQPYGAFDFTGAEGRFTPRQDALLPLDVFVVSSDDPVVIMGEYARITGVPELPARWTLGYMQSHRTLDGPDEILGVARTFREKQLPCDALIYLGTEFAPSGWNTRNGEFTWHPTNFPDPRVQLAALHDLDFRVVVHVVIEGRQLEGSVSDPCTADALPSGRTEDDRWPPRRQVSCYWPVHQSVMDDGVDGWWPDQGDGFDGPSRFNRHRMYWEGTQLIRPNERPFALHRNASPGVQRYGGFIWSGDVQSRWETLATHVSVAINTGLSGLPYWGTDIGGFIPTEEYTGELHVRWFQFGAFCPSFRSHGRNWHLRLPWGWDGGDGGPEETRNFTMDPAHLRNADVEPICRKYLELRYRLLPYTYSVVREATQTGLPIMRGLWLHHPDDAGAVARGDEFLWGRDLLVAPVVEPGATTRRVYLPRGRWWDFWTEEAVEGGAEVARDVDLETMPLYVRAGAIVPTGPVVQHTGEIGETTPLDITVYPGADGAFEYFDDDGSSFDYRNGAWLGLTMRWDDAAERLSIELTPGSRLEAPRSLHIRLAGSEQRTTVEFRGQPLVVDKR